MLTGRMAAALPTFSRKFTRGSLNILNRILNHLNHVCTLQLQNSERAHFETFYSVCASYFQDILDNQVNERNFGDVLCRFPVSE